MLLILYAREERCWSSRAHASIQPFRATDTLLTQKLAITTDMDNTISVLSTIELIQAFGFGQEQKLITGRGGF